MSDISNHEDQSEPTVATLSSEATGEMDVSSLDDKSQTETHIEKRGELGKCLKFSLNGNSNVEQFLLAMKIMLLQ